MSGEPKLPRGAVQLAAEALRGVGVHPGDNGEIARMALTAAWPLIERDVRRKMAREILFLDEVDRACRHNVGPWGSMDVSLSRLSRGEPLPDWRDLHGGEGGRPGAQSEASTEGQADG